MPKVTLIDVLTKKTTAPVGTYVPNPPPVVTPPSTPPSSGGGGGGGSSGGGSTQPEVSAPTNDTGLTQEQLDKAKNILTGGGLQVTTFPLPEATITVSPDVIQANAEPSFNRPSQTATPEVLSTQVTYQQKGIITQGGTPQPPSQPYVGDPNAAKNRVDKRIQSEIVPVVQNQANLISQNTYNNLISRDFNDAGIQKDANGQYQITNPSSGDALIERGWTTVQNADGTISYVPPKSYEQQATDAGTNYFNTQINSPGIKSSIQTIQSQEYGKENYVTVTNADGTVSVVPRPQYEQQQQFQSERAGIVSRMKGEQGGVGSLQELARFWYSGFTPGNLLYTQTIGEILFGGKDKTQNIVDDYTKVIMDANALIKNIGPIGAFVKPYEPGGFGFTGTLAALFMVGGPALGAVGAAGKGGAIIAKSIPYVAMGGFSAVAGADIGYTFAQEKLGNVRQGAGLTESLKFGAQIAMMYGIGKYIEGPKTAVTMYGQGETVQGVSVQKYYDIFGLKIKTGKPVVGIKGNAEYSYGRFGSEVQGKRTVTGTEMTPLEYARSIGRTSPNPLEYGYVKQNIPTEKIVGSVARNEFVRVPKMSDAFTFSEQEITKAPNATRGFTFEEVVKTPSDFNWRYGQTKDYNIFSDTSIMNKTESMPSEREPNVSITKAYEIEPGLYAIASKVKGMPIETIGIATELNQSSKGELIKTKESGTDVIRYKFKNQNDNIKAVAFSGVSVWKGTPEELLFKPNKSVERLSFGKYVGDKGDVLVSVNRGVSIIDKDIIFSKGTSLAKTIEPGEQIVKKYPETTLGFTKNKKTISLSFGEYGNKTIKGKYIDFGEVVRPKEKEVSFKGDTRLSSPGGELIIKNNELILPGGIGLQTELEGPPRLFDEYPSAKTKNVSLSQLEYLEGGIQSSGRWTRTFSDVKRTSLFGGIGIISKNKSTGELKGTELNINTLYSPVQKSAVMTGTISDTKKDVASVSITDISLKQDVSSINKVITALSLKQDILTRQIVSPVTVSINDSGVITMDVNPEVSGPRTEKIKTEKPSTSILGLDMGFLSKGKSVLLSGGIGEQAYNVQVKGKVYSQGKRIAPDNFHTINKQPLSYNDALAFGANVIGKNEKASFRVVETDGKPHKLSSKVSSFWSVAHQYNRKDNNTFVEKPAYRINSPGELMAITMKGIQANRRR